MGACPDENVLVRLAHGGVGPGGELAGLEAHLDACPACRQLVAAVAGGSAPASPRELVSVLQPGDRMGRYQVERLIGAGGMGVLYVAHDLKLDRRVALKLMRPGYADEAGKTRLMREAQAMARLSHPNVVNVFDLGEVGEQLFLAMELVEGGTLRDWLREPRPWREVLETFLAAGEGLAAAHRAGVVHRDFKPENVLVGADRRPRVTDFGLARPGEPTGAPDRLLATGAVELTRAGTTLGTPAYMSPEQLNRGTVDARSDQYSFCIALYEALYGRRPFEGSTLEEVRAQVLGGVLKRPVVRDRVIPERAWNAIARGLSPSPDHRFPTMEALLGALRAGPSRAVQWAGGAAAVLAVLLALVVVGVSGSRPPVAPPAAAPVAAPAPTPRPPDEPKEPAAPVAPAEERVVMKLEPEALPLAEAQIVLEPGAVRSYHARDLQRVAVGDPKIVDVTAAGDRLELRGKEAGRTTLLLWTQGGRKSLVVTVRPAVAANAGGIVFERGAQRVLRIPGITRVAIGSPSTADVKVLGSDELLLVGAGEGHTTLMVWTKDARRLEYSVWVKPPNPDAADGSSIRLEVGHQKVLAVQGLARIAVGDPGIADVKPIGDSQVLITATGEGKTTLLVWKSDGARLTHTLVVRAATGAR